MFFPLPFPYMLFSIFFIENEIFLKVAVLTRSPHRTFFMHLHTVCHFFSTLTIDLIISVNLFSRELMNIYLFNLFI